MADKNYRESRNNLLGKLYVNRERLVPRRKKKVEKLSEAWRGEGKQRQVRIKEPRNGGASYGPGAIAALHPYGGLSAKHTESVLHPGTQEPREYTTDLESMEYGKRTGGRTNGRIDRHR